LARASLGKSRLSLARFSLVAAAGKAGSVAKKKKDAAWMTWEGETDLERGIPWEKSRIAAQFARELIETKLEPLMATVRSEDGEERVTSDHGVMLLRTTTPLLDDEVAWPHHFSRRCLREIWDGLASFKYDRFKSRFYAIVVGAPCWDKSRSIVYGLKKLFEAGRTVALELRRDKNVFAFVPRKRPDGKAEYDAWWCEMSDFKGGKCAAVKRVDTCCIMNATAKLWRARRRHIGEYRIPARDCSASTYFWRLRRPHARAPLASARFASALRREFSRRSRDQLKRLRFQTRCYKIAKESKRRSAAYLCIRAERGEL
jgi:hypothetical protein